MPGLAAHDAALHIHMQAWAVMWALRSAFLVPFACIASHTGWGLANIGAGRVRATGVMRLHPLLGGGGVLPR